MSHPNDDRYFSYSMLRLFQQCERRYYYERILKTPTPKTSFLVVGEVYHAALAELAAGSTLPIGNIVNEALRKFEDPLKEVNVNPDNLAFEMRTNLHRVLTLIGPFALTALPMPAGAEKSLSVEIKFLDRARGYVGVLDLLSKNTPVSNDKGQVVRWLPGTHCVIDWKILTGDRRRTQRSATLSAQLGLYALEAGVRHVGYVEIPRNSERPINVQVVEFSEPELRLWDAHLTKVRRTALARGKDIENYALCSRENGLCSPLYCPFWDCCYGGKPNAVHPAGGSREVPEGSPAHT
jgi:hypothetical protein